MKFKIFLVILTIISTSGWAQQKKILHSSGYVIKGEITGLKANYLYLIKAGIRDSIPVKNGKFSFKGKVSEPTKLYLSDAKGIGQSFYVENEPVTIKGNVALSKHLNITGGKTQSELNLLNFKLNPTIKAMDSLNAAYETASPAKDSISMAKIEQGLMLEEDNANAIIKSFIIAHPSSFVNLDRIIEMSYVFDYIELSKLFESLRPTIKTSASGKRLQAQLKVLHRGGNGQKMIDFVQNDLQGKPFKLSSLKGRYLLVDFWASWCGPCRSENPNLLKVFKRFSSKGFTVLGVSLDYDDKKWRNAVQEDQLSWTQVSDLKGWKNEVAIYYGIQGIPSNYLVDPNGIIIARNLRGEELVRKLESILNH